MEEVVTRRLYTPDVDLTALLPIAAPIAVVFGALATLFGVWLTQSNNRKLKKMELEHNQKLKEMELEQQRELRLIDLRADAARLVRAERRAVYLEVMRIFSNVINFWLSLREYGIEDNYPELSQAAQNQAKAYVSLLPELHMCGSDELRRRSRNLIATLSRCSEVLEESAEAEVIDPSDEQEVEAGWQRAVDAALQEYDNHDVNKMYWDLVAQIKDEMGSLTLRSDFGSDPAQGDVQEQRGEVETSARTGSADPT